MEFLNDDLEILDIVENGFPRRIYDRSNYFDEMDNLTFFKRFRLRKPTMLNVLEQIEEDLEFEEDRNQSVSPMNQLLTCLRLYATGSHLACIADFMGMDTSTASRIVKKVSHSLALLAQEYIKMPTGEEVASVQNRFFEISSFPRVIGCVDGTHIRIQSRGGQDGEVFRNRKGFFSINTQVVGDADLKIRDLVARWPGSAHDQTIFNNSRVRASIENGDMPNSLLLGDSGYRLRTYMLTPFHEPNNEGERIYNEAQIRTRNTVERLFGVWKRRFPILAYGIRLKLDRIFSLIPATAVLHNIAINQNEDEPLIDEEHIAELNYLIEMGNIPDVRHHVDDENDRRGNRHSVVRNNIVNYFANFGRRNNVAVR